MAALTEDEREELRTTPAGSIIEMDEQQFVRRLNIAKKLCFGFFVNDQSLSEQHRELYQMFPLWGFYLTKNAPLPKRSFGVMYNSETGEILLHTVACFTLFSSVTVGGTPEKDLVQVDRWPEKVFDIIKSSTSGGIFADPLGFLVLLDQYGTEDE